MSPLITVGEPGTITVQTWSYGGGVNFLGLSVPAGGFNPDVTLFDPAGFYLNDSSLGSCPPANADSGNCFDATLVVPVSATGVYTVTLSAWPNVAAGATLADGFTDGGDFFGRSPNYAMDITYPASVPEPPGSVLLVVAIIVVPLLRKTKTLKYLS